MNQVCFRPSVRRPCPLILSPGAYPDPYRPPPTSPRTTFRTSRSQLCSPSRCACPALPPPYPHPRHLPHQLLPFPQPLGDLQLAPLPPLQIAPRDQHRRHQARQPRPPRQVYHRCPHLRRIHDRRGPPHQLAPYHHLLHPLHHRDRRPVPPLSVSAFIRGPCPSRPAISAPNRLPRRTPFTPAKSKFVWRQLFFPARGTARSVGRRRSRTPARRPTGEGRGFPPRPETLPGRGSTSNFKWTAGEYGGFPGASTPGAKRWSGGAAASIGVKISTTGRRVGQPFRLRPVFQTGPGEAWPGRPAQRAPRPGAPLARAESPPRFDCQEPYLNAYGGRRGYLPAGNG